MRQNGLALLTNYIHFGMKNENEKTGESAAAKQGNGLLAWLVCVLGWVLCAAMCLALTIELENWPQAYDMLFPAILLILFCNILVFLFVASRWGRGKKSLFGSVARVCIGEGLLLGGLYLLGRFAIGG